MLIDKAVLKQVTDLEDCAAIYVSIAENTSMTGQKVAIGAYSYRILSHPGDRTNTGRCRLEHSGNLIKTECWKIRGLISKRSKARRWPQLLYNSRIESIRSSLPCRICHSLRYRSRIAALASDGVVLEFLMSEAQHLVLGNTAGLLVFNCILSLIKRSHALLCFLR